MTQIDVQNLTKIIHNNIILDDISIHLKSGKIYGLQGINGSGKTMLMRAIIGLIRPTKGSISINGQVLGKEIEFPPSVGFLLENPTFLNRYSGFENLQILANIKKQVSDEEIVRIIQTVGLHPQDKKKYKKYSLGMKQRLGIAAAIMEKPDIVILDEPTNALDEAGVQFTKDILREQKQRGALCIISCHDFSVLKELSDEIISMKEGKIIEHITFDEEVAK